MKFALLMGVFYWFVRALIKKILGFFGSSGSAFSTFPSPSSDSELSKESWELGLRASPQPGEEALPWGWGCWDSDTVCLPFIREFIFNYSKPPRQTCEKSALTQ